MQPRTPTPFFVARTHCWLTFSLASTRTPRSFSSCLLSSTSWCLRLFLPRRRALHFPVELHEVPLGPFVRPVAVSPAGSTALWHISRSSQFRVISKLSATSSRPLMKTLNRTRPSVDPWGAALVTGLQLDFVPLITTLWAQLFSQFLNHLSAQPARAPTASKRILWKTGSKSFLE